MKSFRIPRKIKKAFRKESLEYEKYPYNQIGFDLWRKHIIVIRNNKLRWR